MDERIRKLIGEKVAELRKQAGYRSQRALAEKLGDVSTSFISQIETGRSRIPDDRLDAFAAALGVEERELLPESLGQKFVSGTVQSQKDMNDWQDSAFQDEDLKWGTKILLLSLGLPPFVDKERWISTVTEEQYLRVSGEADRARMLVENHWDDMLQSGYVERIGEVRWVLRLVFPGNS